MKRLLFKRRVHHFGNFYSHSLFSNKKKEIEFLNFRATKEPASSDIQSTFGGVLHSFGLLPICIPAFQT